MGLGYLPSSLHTFSHKRERRKGEGVGATLEWEHNAEWILLLTKSASARWPPTSQSFPLGVSPWHLVSPSFLCFPPHIETWAPLL